MLKKSTTIKVLILWILLVSSGIFTLVVLGNRAPVRIESDSSKLNRLMADIGVAGHPFSTNTLGVRLQDTAGQYVSLGDYRGKVVFLSFWTTWCPTCITEMPAMEKLHRKLAGKNFAMVTVNIKESASRVKTFFENYKLSATALLDLTGEVSTEFGIRAIPTTFILDKKGNIIGRIAGPREWDSKKAVALFMLLAETEVRGQTTRLRPAEAGLRRGRQKTDDKQTSIRGGENYEKIYDSKNRPLQ